MRPPRDPGRLEVVRRLSHEFDGMLSPFAVAAEVVAAESELHGRVPPAELDEMLHRLAGQWLRRLDTQQPPQAVGRQHGTGNAGEDDQCHGHPGATP
jgi:hypothetical protein